MTPEQILKADSENKNPSGESREAEGSQITDTGRVVEDQGVSLAQAKTVDEWTTWIPNEPGEMLCRIVTHPQYGVDAEFFHPEEKEWVQDGDYNGT
jgi:hypothetical protein